MQTIITKDNLMKLGYSKYTAISIIRQSGEIMVKQGYTFYDNKRLGRVPRDTVETILGCELELEETDHG